MAEEALAYWFCDDGSYHDGFCYLHTYGYGYESQIVMQKLLYDKFGLEFDIKKSGSKGRNDDKKHHLGLSAKKSYNFIDLIRPHIIDSMRYKIGEKKK